MASAKEHLERLIFEVHGVEEGKRKIDELRKKEEEHAKSLKGLQKQAKETAKAEEDASKRRIAANKKAAEETKKTAQVAGVALLALAKLAVDATATLEEAQGRVERSARKAGATQKEFTRALDEADSRARSLGLGLADTRNHLDKLLGSTNDLTTAVADLSLAQDIAASESTVDLQQAVELLTQARKGEVEELKKLDGLNKSSIEALQAIADDGRRGAAAIKTLAHEYNGAAQELRGTANALENVKQAAADFLAVVGDTGKGLVNGLAQMFGIIEQNEDLLDRFALGLRNAAADAREASTIIQDMVEYRASQGVVGSMFGFEEYLSEKDSQRARDRAARGGNTNASSAFRGVRGGRGGYGGGRGGHRDVRGDGSSKKRGAKRQRDDGSGALATEDVDDNEVWQEIWQEAYGNDIERFRSAWEEKNRITQEAMDFQAESARSLVEVMKDVPDVIGETAKMEKDAAKIRNDTIMAGIEGSASLAKSVIKDKGAQAVIDGGLEIARAAGSYPDPVGMATHGFAAAQYFAMAAQAGVSGGGSKMGGGRRQRGVKGERYRKGGEVEASDREAVGRLGSGQTQDTGKAPIVINIGSTLGFHPQQTREFVGELERELKTRTGGYFGPRGGGV